MQGDLQNRVRGHTRAQEHKVPSPSRDWRARVVHIPSSPNEQRAGLQAGVTHVTGPRTQIAHIRSQAKGGPAALLLHKPASFEEVSGPDYMSWAEYFVTILGANTSWSSERRQGCARSRRSNPLASGRRMARSSDILTRLAGER